MTDIFVLRYTATLYEYTTDNIIWIIDKVWNNLIYSFEMETRICDVKYILFGIGKHVLDYELVHKFYGCVISMYL